MWFILNIFIVDFPDLSWKYDKGQKITRKNGSDITTAPRWCVSVHSDGLRPDVSFSYILRDSSDWPVCRLYGPINVGVKKCFGVCAGWATPLKWMAYHLWFWGFELFTFSSIARCRMCWLQCADYIEFLLLYKITTRQNSKAPEKGSRPLACVCSTFRSALSVSPLPPTHSHSQPPPPPLTSTGPPPHLLCFSMAEKGSREGEVVVVVGGGGEREAGDQTQIIPWFPARESSQVVILAPRGSAGRANWVWIYCSVNPVASCCSFLISLPLFWFNI